MSRMTNPVCYSVCRVSLFHIHILTYVISSYLLLKSVSCSLFVLLAKICTRLLFFGMVVQFYHTLVKQWVLLNLMKVARLCIRHSYRKDEYMLKIADMCTSVGILSSLSAIVLGLTTEQYTSFLRNKELLSMT